MNLKKILEENHFPAAAIETHYRRAALLTFIPQAEAIHKGVLNGKVF